MEAYLPTDSEELIISILREEKYFVVQALCGFMDHARQAKNKFGFTTRDNRKKIKQAQLLYTRIGHDDFNGQLITEVNDREVLQEALVFGLETVTSALMGKPTDDLTETSAQNHDQLLDAWRSFGEMLLALENEGIKNKTDTFNRLERELAGVASE